jgi:hypothetical protein
MSGVEIDKIDLVGNEAFKPFVEMAIAGGLRDTINAMLADKAIYRSPQAPGSAYEHPENLFAAPRADRTAYTRSQRFVAASDNKHTVSMEPQLRQLAESHASRARS